MAKRESNKDSYWWLDGKALRNTSRNVGHRQRFKRERGVRISERCLLRNSSKSLTGSLELLSVAYTSRCFSVLRHQATSMSLHWILAEAYACCHFSTLDLDPHNFEVLHISAVMILAASKPKVLGQVFVVDVR